MTVTPTPFLDQTPYAALLLLPVLGAVGFPFPEDLILLSCGALIARGVVIPLPASIAVYAGILLGDLIIYGLARRLGTGLLSRRPFRRLITRERAAYFEECFRTWGPLLIIAGRQIPVIRAQIIAVAGLTKVPFCRFLVMDAVAALITSGLLVSAGSSGSNLAVYVSSHIPAVLALLLLGVGIITCWAVFRCRRRGKNGMLTEDVPL